MKAGRGSQVHAGLIMLMMMPCIIFCRMRKPISDEEALSIGKEFEAPSLFEHVARARRSVVGSAFPIDIV